MTARRNAAVTLFAASRWEFKIKTHLSPFYPLSFSSVFYILSSLLHLFPSLCLLVLLLFLPVSFSQSPPFFCLICLLSVFFSFSSPPLQYPSFFFSPTPFLHFLFFYVYFPPFLISFTRYSLYFPLFYPLLDFSFPYYLHFCFLSLHSSLLLFTCLISFKVFYVCFISVRLCFAALISLFHFLPSPPHPALFCFNFVFLSYSIFSSSLLQFLFFSRTSLLHFPVLLDLLSLDFVFF